MAERRGEYEEPDGKEMFNKETSLQNRRKKERK
jgi:hypothetical protein